MDKLIEKLIAYLEEVTGLKVVARPMFEAVELPYNLDRQYARYALTIGSQQYIGLFLRDPETFRPSVLEKHLNRLLPDEKDPYCIVAPTLPAYVRKRLLERRIPFVVPWSQLYLPTFGMEHRQRSMNRVRSQVMQLSPATQVVVISALMGRVGERTRPSELAAQLNYTAMTMTRALHEIESTGLGMIRREGRERLLSFPEDRKSLWEEARPRLQSPVTSLISILKKYLSQEELPFAGESALATYTQLADPPVPVYAISKERGQRMRQEPIEQVPIGEEGSCLLQVWRYNPTTLGEPGRVDPFSLYLSLQNEDDERVQIALEEMMENRAW